MDSTDKKTLYLALAATGVVAAGYLLWSTFLAGADKNDEAGEAESSEEESDEEEDILDPEVIRERLSKAGLSTVDRKNG